MLVTVFWGPLNMYIALVAVIITFIICLVYQLTRSKWNVKSIGEIVLGTTNKHDILQQRKLFRITRIPLFVLVFTTLVLNGNLMDALAEGKAFSAGNVAT